MPIMMVYDNTCTVPSSLVYFFLSFSSPILDNCHSGWLMSEGKKMNGKIIFFTSIGIIMKTCDIHVDIFFIYNKKGMCTVLLSSMTLQSATKLLRNVIWKNGIFWRKILLRKGGLFFQIWAIKWVSVSVCLTLIRPHAAPLPSNLGMALIASLHFTKWH